MTKPRFNIDAAWKASDPREAPAYSIAQAAHYLCIPKQTLRAWVCGTSYGRSGNRKTFEPVIDLPDPTSQLLSFFNLAEVHVLRALRTDHAIKLPMIRKALDFVRQKFGWERPLLQQEFKTDGVRLFVEHLGTVIDATGGGQLVIASVMAHLDRLEREDSLVARLYPFTRLTSNESPRSVLIDPRFAFGRPLLSRSRIATSAIAERYKAGESIDSLATDYGCDFAEIEEAIRCELPLAIAA